MDIYLLFLVVLIFGLLFVTIITKDESDSLWR